MLVLLPPVIIGTAATELKSIIDRVFGFAAHRRYCRPELCQPHLFVAQQYCLVALLSVLSGVVELFVEENS